MTCSSSSSRPEKRNAGESLALHDDTVQSLVGTRYFVEQLASLSVRDEERELCDRITTSLRNLEEFGIAARLDNQLEGRVGPETESRAFRCVQRALSNVSASRAQHVVVSLGGGDSSRLGSRSKMLGSDYRQISASGRHLGIVASCPCGRLCWPVEVTLRSARARWVAPGCSSGSRLAWRAGGSRPSGGGARSAQARRASLLRPAT